MLVALAFLAVGLFATVDAEFVGDPDTASPPETVLYQESPDTVQKEVLEDATETLAIYKEEAAEDLSDPQSPQALGLAAFAMANFTHQAAWSKRAIEHFKSDENSDLSLAYYGSSSTLFARDYPYQGLWQIFPGPGFARMYYVGRGKSALNDAVEADPENPVIRLIRAATFSGLPWLFREEESAAEDFARLRAAIADPSGPHQSVLASDAFRLAVLYQDARRLDRLERNEEAAETWTEMARLAPADSFHGALARWKLGEPDG